jgi:hypothetical protein
MHPNGIVSVSERRARSVGGAVVEQRSLAAAVPGERVLLRVEKPEPRADEAPLGEIGAELRVQVVNDRGKILTGPDRHSQHRADLGHGEREADPVSAGVGQQQDRVIGLGRRQAEAGLVRDPPIADDVVGVTPGLVGRFAPGVDLESGHDGNLLGQGVPLDAPSHLQIALDLQQRPKRPAHLPVGIGESMDFPDR